MCIVAIVVAWDWGFPYLLTMKFGIVGMSITGTILTLSAMGNILNVASMVLSGEFAEYLGAGLMAVTVVIAGHGLWGFAMYKGHKRFQMKKAGK